jgi:hypothetical protein
VKTKNGMIAEIQIVSPKMTFGKNMPKASQGILGKKLFEKIKAETGIVPGEGHKIYEKFRQLNRADKTGARGAELIKQSFDYYGKLS